MGKSKYLAFLINSQRCTFDKTESNSLREIKEWSRGRGGEYQLIVRPNKINSPADMVEDVYNVAGRRVSYVGTY